MSRNDHESFLSYVQKYVYENPDVAAYVSDSVAIGLQKKLSDANERALDMETALVGALTKRNKKWADGIVLSKLKKWDGRCCMIWDHVIKELEDQK